MRIHFYRDVPRPFHLFSSWLSVDLVCRRTSLQLVVISPATKKLHKLHVIIYDKGTPVRTHDLWIMHRTCHAPEMLALATEPPSGTSAKLGQQTYTHTYRHSTGHTLIRQSLLQRDFSIRDDINNSYSASHDN